MLAEPGVSQDKGPHFFSSHRVKAVGAPVSVFLKAIDRCRFATEEEDLRDPDMGLVNAVVALLSSGDRGQKTP